MNPKLSLEKPSITLTALSAILKSLPFSSVAPRQCVSRSFSVLGADVIMMGLLLE